MIIMSLFTVLLCILIHSGTSFVPKLGSNLVTKQISKRMATTSPSPSSTAGNPLTSILENLDFQKVAEKVTDNVQFLTEDSMRVRYIMPMLVRVGFFLGQGVTLSAIGIDKPAVDADQTTSTQLNPVSVIAALQDALLTDDVDLLAQPDAELADELANKVSDDELQRNLFAKNFASIIGLLRKELKNIENGDYKLPYDLDLRENSGIISRRQWNPVAVASQLIAYTRDRREVLDRRDRRDGQEVTKTWQSNKYPDYYLQNFHYQSDGWFSSKSARLYDYQVESLFLGTADAMRRQILPSIKDYFDELGREGINKSEIKHLDVATGTGRFASFVLDNHDTLDTTVLDLSPFYLQEARSLLKRFSQVKYMQAAAEDIAMDDASVDAITCVYLFHELPFDVRREALKEFYRVLKPGGKLFFVDSAQKGEVPYDRVLKGFTIIAHEPYYMNYSEMDLSGMMAEVGFQVDSSDVHWVSKSVVATKPESITATFTTKIEEEEVEELDVEVVENDVDVTTGADE